MVVRSESFCATVHRGSSHFLHRRTSTCCEIKIFKSNQYFSINHLSIFLRFDLKLSRKVLSKRDREARPHEIQCFYEKLSRFYSGPEQLVFLDETSKDGRDGFRAHGWSAVNTRVEVALPFVRGKQLSALAAIDSRVL
jgi:hypothetical protein